MKLHNYVVHLVISDNGINLIFSKCFNYTGTGLYIHDCCYNHSLRDSTHSGQLPEETSLPKN